MPRLRLPEPLHDELEVRRLDAILRGPSRRPRRSRPPTTTRPTSTWSRTASTSSSSISTGAPGELVEARDRARDGRTGRRAVEPVEREVVAEDVRDSSGEHVQLGERVLAQRDQHVDRQVRAASRSRRVTRRARRPPDRRTPPRTGRARDTGLLPATRRPAPPARLPGSRPATAAPCRARPRRRRRSPPAGSPAHESWTTTVASGASARSRRTTPGAEHRALPDAQRPVEHREARRHHVGGDHLRLALPAEEEQGVEVAVVERGEALVRARGQDGRRFGHRGASTPTPRWRASESTYSSSGASSEVDVAAAPERALHRAAPRARPPTSGT